jgi:hypothetical protein
MSSCVVKSLFSTPCDPEYHLTIVLLAVYPLYSQHPADYLCPLAIFVSQYE